jgi:SET domain-containing protein
VITDIEVRDTATKGKGVFALRHFAAGEFIFRRRRGRIIANSEIATLSAEDQRHLDEIDEDTSEILTSPGCYFNHSCAPNAMPHGMDLYAWKDIESGEEITVDYRLSAISENRWDCTCGSANCLGYFDHSFFALSEETQRRYLPYAPAYVRAAYRARQRTRSSGQ